MSYCGEDYSREYYTERDLKAARERIASLTAERDAALASVAEMERRRDLDIRSGRPAGCICDYGPNTDGPDECCPQHGREYGYWVEGCWRLNQRVAEMEAREQRVRAVLAESERITLTVSRNSDLRAALGGAS